MKTLLFLVMSCLIGLSPSILANTFTFNKIVVFGDSLSDTGNLYKYTLHELPKTPPYYMGRFSNGPVWVEYLAHFLKTPLEDYAVGGASDALHWGNKQLPLTLTKQIDSYVLANFLDIDMSKILFIIWAGGNDYLDGSNRAPKNVYSALKAMTYNIQWLIDNRGAKYFLIPNLPNLGKIPLAKKEYNKTKRNNLTTASELHNKYIAELTQSLQKKNPNAVFIFFDVNKLFNQIMQHPDEYKIKYVDDQCYKGKDDFTKYLKNLKKLVQIIKVKQFGVIKLIYKNWKKPMVVKRYSCQGYLFWDHVHPTTHIHQILAKKICLQLKNKFPDLQADCLSIKE